MHIDPHLRPEYMLYNYVYYSIMSAKVATPMPR